MHRPSAPKIAVTRPTSTPHKTPVKGGDKKPPVKEKKEKDPLQSGIKGVKKGFGSILESLDSLKLAIEAQSASFDELSNVLLPGSAPDPEPEEPEEEAKYPQHEQAKRICINIGGTKFETTEKTLMKERKNLFWNYFDKYSLYGVKPDIYTREEEEEEDSDEDDDPRVLEEVVKGWFVSEYKNENGFDQLYFFIDRTPQSFGYILDYLRNDNRLSVDLDKLDEGDLMQLTKDAHYFQMNKLKKLLPPLPPDPVAGVSENQAYTPPPTIRVLQWDNENDPLLQLCENGSTIVFLKRGASPHFVERYIAVKPPATGPLDYIKKWKLTFVGFDQDRIGFGYRNLGDDYILYMACTDGIIRPEYSKLLKDPPKGSARKLTFTFEFDPSKHTVKVHSIEEDSTTTVMVPRPAGMTLPIGLDVPVPMVFPVNHLCSCSIQELQ